MRLRLDWSQRHKAGRPVEGRVFEANGDRINLCVGWTRGRWVDNGRQRWDAATLGSVVVQLVAEAPPRTTPAG